MIVNLLFVDFTLYVLNRILDQFLFFLTFAYCACYSMRNALQLVLKSTISRQVLLSSW